MKRKRFSCTRNYLQRSSSTSCLLSKRSRCAVRRDKTPMPSSHISANCNLRPSIVQHFYYITSTYSSTYVAACCGVERERRTWMSHRMEKLKSRSLCHFQACEMPQSPNSPSHYICDDNGEVKCLPGWQGDLCDVPICRRGCDPMNGYCKRPNECRCKIGFYGEKCDKCIPLPGCQHGYCKASFECICKEGWDGLFCSERKKRENLIKLPSPCLNSQFIYSSSDLSHRLPPDSRIL